MMHKLERLLYFIIWILSILYSLYKISLASAKFHYLLDQNDFIPGTLINNPKDISDFEWIVLKQMLIRNYHLIIIHLCLTQVLSRINQNFLPIYFVIYSSICIIYILSPQTLFIFLLNIFISIILHQHFIEHKIICYLFFLLTLYCIHSSLFTNLISFCQLNKHESFLFEVSMAWLNAKCLSFSIDRIRSVNQIKTKTNSRIRIKDVILIMSYCLYFPAFYTGPIYQYNNFVNNLSSLPKSWSFSRVFSALINLFRYSFWIFILELLTHIIYSSSIQFYPELCHEFDGWTLAGLGYALPCLFFIKYFIIYGSVKLIASIDGFDMPNPPKCVSRIHLCRFLWRYFDHGLHLWLKEYFYGAIIGSKWNVPRQIIAGFVCFSCVCIWHGMDSAVTAWCVLNFFGVAIELTGLRLSKTRFWILSMRNFSASSQVRIYAMLATPFFAIAFTSNIFFLSNWDVGWYFVKRMLFSFPTPVLPILMIMYAGSQVSIYYKDKEERNNHRHEQFVNQRIED